MGLVWNRSESAQFQTQLRNNLAVWKQGLASYQQQIDGLQTKLGTGPTVELSGMAWNAAKSLFVDRIRPIVDSGLSACVRTESNLGTYSTAETPLLGDSSIREDSLQSAKDNLDQEIYEATHWWVFALPLRQDDEDVKQLRNQAAALQNKIDQLRTFATTVNGLFSAENALTAPLTASVSSIRQGRLSADGSYMPDSYDYELWQYELDDYTNNGPRCDPGAVVAPNGRVRNNPWTGVYTIWRKVVKPVLRVSTAYSLTTMAILKATAEASRIRMTIPLSGALAQRLLQGIYRLPPPSAAFAAKVNPVLTKFAPIAGKLLGVLGGGVMIYDGLKHAINPDYSGARGVVDQVMGVVSVGAGVGTVAGSVLAGTALAIGPVGWAAIGVAAAAVGVWQLGNYLYDNNETFRKTVNATVTTVKVAAQVAWNWLTKRR